MTDTMASARRGSAASALHLLQKKYLLETACALCTTKHDHITYSLKTLVHGCSGELLLAQPRGNGPHWRPVARRPVHPLPSLYEVCWFFDKVQGCTIHKGSCTFARSPVEAEVWNFLKQHNLDHFSLVQSCKSKKTPQIQMSTPRPSLGGSAAGTAPSRAAAEHLASTDTGGGADLTRRNSRSPGTPPYQDRLLQEYRESSNEIHIMSEHVDDVIVTHDQELCLDCDQIGSAIQWRFQIQTERSLAHVALLRQNPGATFTLGERGGPRTYCAGPDLQTSECSYDLILSFQAVRPGVYEQWLVFDFAIRPVLLRKLRVRVGQQFTSQPDEVPEARVGAAPRVERWHRGNKVIVPIMTRTQVEEQLLRDYKPPLMNPQFISPTDGQAPLTRKNYSERMHNFLYDEELAEDHVISRLNHRGTVVISDRLHDPVFGTVWARKGELFASVPVSRVLLSDTPEGTLLKRMVSTALVGCAADGHSSPVYEAALLKESTSESHLHLLLPKRCCSELKLQKDSSPEMEVQFQLTRQVFCEMHKSIDLLPDLKNVLPDFRQTCVPQHRAKYPELNAKQCAAMAFILGHSEVDVAPLLIYGPFGTGKTLTLAFAAKELVQQLNNRVLICTHTNSSADLYVRVHFHHYVESGHPEVKPLRIKANKGGRGVGLTDDITLKYCLCSPDGMSFLFPRRSHLDSHRVVITTTSMSQHLLDLNLPDGYFSHILIDEASQMLECEALMALVLAGTGTRVVLAGDHKQMGPKLFSVKEGEGSNHALLNRLFRCYQADNNSTARESRIIFNENYRSTKEIVEFVSTHFYVGESDAIKASGNVAPHPKQPSLRFQHVMGECRRDPMSHSWYNLPEIGSVVEVVQKIVHEWPVAAWGDQKLKEICVLSEGSQVSLIRDKLRHKGLRKVTVQNFADTQGKQFRVMVLSTVQTRHQLLSGSCCPDFFNDCHVLNTAMTRAQSQLVVVGDAAALCCFGRCAGIWRSYIEHSICEAGAEPQHLTCDFLSQEIAEISKFLKPADVTDSMTCAIGEDLIMQELIDEYAAMSTEGNGDSDGDGDAAENVCVQDQRRGCYSSANMNSLLELVRRQPNLYKHGELVLKRYDSGYIIPFDRPTAHILVEGRKNIGLSFSGDEVVVSINPSRKDKVSGKVEGVTKSADSCKEFVCNLEGNQKQWKNDKAFARRLMVPISNNVTKICILVKKKARNLIPIWRNKNGEWSVTDHIHVNEETRQKYVFVVQILCWRDRCAFPLGNVTGVLPVGGSLEEGLKILDIEFQLTTPPPQITCSAVINPNDEKNRTDFRSLLTFTVDSPNAQNLDDAISVNDLGSHYEIGIHITDVASSVSKDDELDRNARMRGDTYSYHERVRTPIFPWKLSISSWSLLPDRDRPAISLIVRVEKSGHVRDKSLVLSLINSNRRLSYQEAEDIINSSTSDELRFDSVEDCINVVYRFAKTQRKLRLHEDWSYSQPDVRRKPGKRKAYFMIEELALMYNCFVSEALLKDVKTNHCTPLRCQALPDRGILEDMIDKHRELMPMSTHLMYHTNKNLAVDIGHLRDTPCPGAFVVLKSVWNEIQSAAMTGDLDKMVDLISADDIHPQLYPVINRFQQALNKAVFICSGSVTPAKAGHYSLQLDWYTHSSSPIRRYIDIVLQRLLHAILSDAPVQYSQTEIAFFCEQLQQTRARALQYRRKAESMSLAISLNSQSVYKLAFVTCARADSDSITLSFPFDKNSFPDYLLLRYRDLQLQDQPLFDMQENHVTLVWEKRVYSVLNVQMLAHPHRPCIEVKPATWHAIIKAVREGSWAYARAIVLNTKVEENHLENEHLDISAENNLQRSADGNFLNSSLQVKVGDTLQVQIGSERGRSCWAPVVQLLSVSPALEICVEHAHSPITCFTRVAEQPSRESYQNTDEYVGIWRPLCEMESAANAVDDSEGVIIEDLQIAWRQEDQNKLSGTFSLPVECLKQWAIKFNLAKCLLCVRKRGMRSCPRPHLAQDGVDPDRYTWVAHGVTTRFVDPAKNSNDHSRKVDFYINHMPLDMPDILQSNESFTVEIIPKLLPDVRNESAVNNIVMANNLVQKIALGHRIPVEASGVVTPKNVILGDQGPPGVPQLNGSQYDAVERALNSPFTLIQGPPGTGKTVVGAYIVRWFWKGNRRRASQWRDATDKKEVVLYCGPSNKSVDVVAEYLLRFGEELKPLRVYSRQMEMQEYPYPGSSLQLSQKSLREERSRATLRGISLHHRIREEQNPHSREITEFDRRIKCEPELLTDEETEEYKRVLNKARLYELQRHDVILCTCSAASSPSLTKTVSARQILIDECAMATEPQALVPLVSYNPERVVLLGDQKQLRPIVRDRLVQRLGMSKSLFERCVNRSRHCMLSTQYRMHEDICEFPSQTFYGGLLKTVVNVRPSVFRVKQQGTGSTKRIIFGDVQGEELSLVVSTARGNENSKANREEQTHVTKICSDLVNKGGVPQKEIAVLSPYNAQVANIRDQLKLDGLHKITICTITKSQGSEWRYVILSMVRSCPSDEIEKDPTRDWLSKHIGFVGDPNQINVGITRAQEGLCILGNQELLSCSVHWKKLLQFYSGRQSVVEADKIFI